MQALTVKAFFIHTYLDYAPLAHQRGCCGPLARAIPLTSNSIIYAGQCQCPCPALKDGTLAVVGGEVEGHLDGCKLAQF